MGLYANFAAKARFPYDRPDRPDSHKKFLKRSGRSGR